MPTNNKTVAAVYDRRLMKTLKIKTPAEADLAKKEALASLQSGEIILFPTETVYGIGAISGNPAVIEKLYDLKGRPREKPFQWMVADPAMAKAHSLEWNEKAEKLARAFWPGPLTLVIPTAEGTTGWRIPNHPWLLGLLKDLNVPLIATSANISGQPSPKDIDTALKPFLKESGTAIDGGTIGEGPASTVVMLDGEHVRILREGAISEKELFRTLA